MKKISKFLLSMTVFLFPLLTNAAPENSTSINERIENEAYLKIDNNLFIDVYGEKSFFRGTDYTIYSESTRRYALGSEWEMEWIDFDRSAYLAGVEVLNLTVSDLKNNRLELKDEKRLSQFFSVQDEGLGSDFGNISKIEILFDKEYRPSKVSYFDNEGNISDAYTINYLSKYSYYGSYYVRRSIEPAYYVYYTASHLFRNQSLMEGLLFSLIVVLSIVLFIWAINRCISGIWAFFTKRRMEKRGKIMTAVSSVILVYVMLAVTFYSFLGLYLLVVACGVHWLFKRIQKK